MSSFGGCLENLKDGLWEEPLTQQLQRCQTANALYVTLNTKLRAYQSYGVGDGRLYVSLTEASRYIQGMCQNSREGQEALRESGVLNSLVEAFVFFYSKHLEDHINPLNHDSLLKCWSNLATALWEAVDNPINKKNQDSVMKKLIEKPELKLIEFVLISSKSVEKQTERYVISLVEVFKALVRENSGVAKLLLAKNYFIPSLAEGLRARLHLSQHENLMWKSIDLMGWLLSMVLQQEATLSDVDHLSGVSCETSSSKSNYEQGLADLVGPSLAFMEKDRLSDKAQSIGIVMMLISLLGRSIDIVQLFIRAKGEMILGQIFASQQTDAVINATKLTFQVLAVQKKRMRESTVVDSNVDAVSMSSKPYSIQIAKSCTMYEADAQQARSGPDTSKPATPIQVVPSNQPKGLENARQWVEMCSIIEQGQGSKSSSDCSPPPPPPPSETETSISQYKAPSVFSFCAPPVIKMDCFCCEPNTTPVFYDRGHTKNWTGIAGYQPPLREISSSRSVPLHRNQFEFASPMERKRKSNDRYPINESGLSAAELSEEDEERSSLISIKIPRKGVNSGRVHGEERLEEKNLEEQFSRIIADLRPCDFMETDDHVVVFCTPPSHKPEDKPLSKSRGTKEFHATNAMSKPKSHNSGVFGRFFSWMFE